MNYQVVIPAAGRGKRMKASKNKLLLELQGCPIIIHTLKVFEQDPNCNGIYLAINEDDRAELEKHIAHHQLHKVQKLVQGGEERQHSVCNALKHVTEELVLVHDGARPFIKQTVIKSLVSHASQSGAAIAAVPVKDTIKKVINNEVEETIDRSSLWMVQTPQAFRTSLLIQSHEEAQAEQYLGTDEASLVERMDVTVGIVESDYDNIKLTTPEDLYFAEAILRKHSNIII